MKVLIYTNYEKENARIIENNLILALKNSKIGCTIIDDNFNVPKDKYDAIFIIGGDGTILRLVEFICKNNLKVIGINAGNLGFLPEFESLEISSAVKMLKSGKYYLDQRLIEEVVYKNKKYLALNDAVIQRVYRDNKSGVTVNLDIFIDGNEVDRIKGDGVIISTPTGSTAYSLSAGGAILAPGINGFSMTPISSHSFNNRPIIYSPELPCKITFVSGGACGLFVDGKFIGELDEEESISVKKSSKKLTFLRRTSSDFYTRLSQKLSGR